jgi:membrane protease YdiL (CAAX protease family)
VTKPGWLGLPFLIAVALGPLTWFLLFTILRPGEDGFSALSSFQANSFALLKLTLVFPLVEELAFRGYLQSKAHAQPWGKSQFSGISVANLLTTFLFCSVHFLYHSFTWSIAVILPSLVFGYFRDRFSSVVPCIILHCFYNAGYYLLFGF